MAFRRHGLTSALLVLLAATVFLAADARKFSWPRFETGAGSAAASGIGNATRGGGPPKNGTRDAPGGGAGPMRGGGKKGSGGGRGRGPMRGANFTGSVATLLRGGNMVGSSGVANSSGHVDIVVIKTATDVDIHFSIAVDRTPTPGLPTSVAIHLGSATTNGKTLLVFPSSAKWRNTTRSGPPPKRSASTAAAANASQRVLYSYMTNGVWFNASSITAASGDSVAAVVKGLVTTPGDYYAVLMTEAFPKGAMRGQFINHTRKF